THRGAGDGNRTYVQFRRRITSVLCEQWRISEGGWPWGRGMWSRLQESIYVGQFLIRHDLGSIRRHLARGLTDVGGEHIERDGVRAQPWSGYRRALRFAAVAFVAAILGVSLLPVFGIPGRGLSRFGSLGRILAPHKRGAEN